MYKIDNATAVAIRPTPSVVGPNPNSYFTRGNPTLATPATIVDDDFLNAVQDEISNVIEGAGVTLDKTDNDQLLTSIGLLSQINSANYVASSTAANTYTATASPTPASYANGMRFDVKFTNANTGAATINFNTLGAKSIKRLDGSALKVGDIQAGMIAILIYDGTNFQLSNPYQNISIKNIVSQVITSTSTYTPTSGMLFARVRISGGGGGGAGTTAGANNYNSGGGGGAGGYAEKIISAADIGASQSVTIGAAGAAGTAAGNGGTGGTTSFGSILSATGGLGGVAVANVANSVTPGGVGGTASGGDINITGGNGFFGLGSSGIQQSIAGYGGANVLSSTSAANNGVGPAGKSYGGGGAGASVINATGVAGGAGAAGVVIIEEFCIAV